MKFSNAGKYQSFSKIKPSDEKKINYSIQKIISDFKNNNDQILVQKFISNPKCSGVIFTRTLEGNAPYYVINYDLSGKTNLITSGKQDSTMRTLTIFKKKFSTINFSR